MSNTNSSEFGRVIIGYDFDTEPSEEEIPFNVCYAINFMKVVKALHNISGYVFCTNRGKGIKQMCPPGTEVSYDIGGCVNKTTTTSVFPIGSRCASQPRQNGGVYFDFSLVDGYRCQCPNPCKGLHCHLLENSGSQCGGDEGKMVTVSKVYTNDMAVDYICLCYDFSRQSVVWGYAATNCHTDELFVPKCEGEHPVGALRFTNKGFYICAWGRDPFMKSCALHHVWNDTQKECVLEKN